MFWGMRFGKDNRVRLARDFEFLKKNSARADCAAFICYIRPSDDASSQSRLAVIASKRVGNAVVRNTARRRFRAIFREHAPNFPAPCDVLVFVRRAYLNFEYAELSRRFEKAVSRTLKQQNKETAPKE